MHKKVMGCLIGALLPCAAAQAQSSVTLYGVADVFYGYFKNSTTSASSLNSGGAGGSRWGLRVKEDLGGGLSAIAVLESGFNINNGTSGEGGRLFGRQSYVGVDSPWGSLIAGRLQTEGYTWGVTFDPILMAAGSVLGSITGEEPRPWIFNPLLDPAREDNAVQYASPTWHGISGTLGYSFGSNQGAATNTKYEIGTLWYTNGSLVASYGLGRSLTVAPGADSNTLEQALGVKYAFKWVTLYGTYQWRRNNPGYTDKAWQVGFNVPTGNVGALGVAYGGLSDENEATPGNWSLRSFALSYTYYLSKSTTLYAFYKKLLNGGVAVQSIYPPGGLPAPTMRDENVSALGVGMQVRF
ncbi:porin [Paraburkholderia bannensis]|uniref:porin n=1 Tax=Paraburkholderia bannensis TaxID=765414 RepID=UPI002ABD4A90|nr:porin [Paraburkholderia bannensis]